MLLDVWWVLVFVVALGAQVVIAGFIKILLWCYCHGIVISGCFGLVVCC